MSFSPILGNCAIFFGVILIVLTSNLFIFINSSLSATTSTASNEIDEGSISMTKFVFDILGDRANSISSYPI